MRYRVTHTTKYIYSEAVPVCHNLVHLEPRRLPNQTCDDFRLLLHPEPVEVVHREDFFGNSSSYFSIERAHLGLTITAASQVEVSSEPICKSTATVPWEEVATNLRTDRSDESLQACQFVFGLPKMTRLAELAEYARRSFPAGRAILEGVLDLTRRIREDFSYDPRATTVQTPIDEVFEKRRGVCQDFAHLQIACIRVMGLAARYVSGYLRTDPPPGKPRLIGADASHAWLSVYCGEAGWIDVDPTNNALASSDYITLAWGSNYNDVCPIEGVIVGGGEHHMQVSVDVALDESEDKLASCDMKMPFNG